MGIFQQTPEPIREFLPLTAGLAVTLGIFWLLDFRVFRRQARMGAEAALPRQLILMGMFIVIFLEIILLVPMSATLRDQILSIFGIVLTGVIAISSTTFVSNIMAGMMLRMIASFKPGDFILSGNDFGRVTERGLFHTEIQTEDRDLTTIPNLRIVSNPVKVVHREGTIVSATLSLGYDVDPEKVEKLLIQAVEGAGLTDPFVLIRELGDFSVTYRASGFYGEVKQLLTRRSDLHKSILKTLHQAGIEIVSPAFMNQRRLDPLKPVIPEKSEAVVSGDRVVPRLFASFPEELIFDKAEEAAILESLKDTRQQTAQEIAELKESQKILNPDRSQSGEIIKKIALLENRLNYIDRQLEIQNLSRDSKG